MAVNRSLVFVDVCHKDDEREKVYSQLKKGSLPDAMKKSFMVKNHGAVYEDNYIGYFLTNLWTNFDTQYVLLADLLLKKGVPLPAFLQDKNCYKTTADFFQHLIFHPRDLYIALQKNPSFVTMLDENQQTLLHHAARSLHTLGEVGAYIILFLLLRASKLDFAIKDKDGNTPLHLVAAKCAHKVADRVVYPSMEDLAFKNHFDFATKNKSGETVSDVLMRVHTAKVLTEEHSLFAKRLSGSKQTIAGLIAEYAGPSPR